MAVKIVTRYITSRGAEHDTLEAAKIAEQVDDLAHELTQAGLVYATEADSLANWLLGNYELTPKRGKPSSPTLNSDSGI